MTCYITSTSRGINNTFRSTSGEQWKVRFHHNQPWLYADFEGKPLWQVLHLPPMQNKWLNFLACILEAAVSQRLSTSGKIT